ncbi:STAS domain-containing protein [Nocardia acidivorans]|uniref:STAS domain-containing protein n=1 Tax=Nocardia acidivorans TaxID=404580 RepID=UPI000A0307E3|nr:STAS domain-containing protein [Nocardia acidivorans]
MSAIAVLQRDVRPDAGSSHPPPPPDRRCVIVRVDGEIDAAVLAEFTAALDEAVAASTRAVVVDLRRARFLSIGGALALATAKVSASARGVDLRVIAVRREIERVLEVTGVRPLFYWYQSVQAALEA